LRLSVLFKADHQGEAGGRGAEADRAVAALMKNPAMVAV
jgi:hypothetical protein